jgi:hypothetical protein
MIDAGQERQESEIATLTNDVSDAELERAADMRQWFGIPSVAFCPPSLRFCPGPFVTNLLDA